MLITFHGPDVLVANVIPPRPKRPMQTYEVLYLTPLLDTDDARAQVRDRVTKVIQDHGGSIIAVREFARQRLAYPIQRHDAGEYVIVECMAPPDALTPIAREFRLDQGLLRNIITVKNEKARAVGAEVEAKERAQMQQDATKATAVKSTPQRSSAATGTPEAIEDLDQKLEEILGKDMV